MGSIGSEPAATAANVSIISSLLINAAVLVAEKYGMVFPYGVDGSALALLASLTIFFAVALLAKPPELPADVAAVMDI
ncbi:MAG: hypothetical protein R3C56_38770 [Pirellulaceae bacterium]